MKVIISGGGTGGHVFPAIAIAKALIKMDADMAILFIGAEGKIEMEKVPNAGFKIVGLPVSGFQRKLTLRNLSFPFKLIRSLLKARKIIKDFKPNVVIGTGGYASGPALKIASRMGIPTVLQEQNSYAGVTNRLLAQKASAICVAYDGLSKFFPGDKIRVTGNPVRKDLIIDENEKAFAKAHFGLDNNKKTILVMGGSLGARTINRAMEAAKEQIEQRPDVQVIWQMGRLYEDQFMNCPTAQLPNVHPMVFIDRMDYAYAVADVAVCRAGALTISELMVAGVPAVLIPSPNVAEDHQTNNAMALVNSGAALMVKDVEAKEKLWPATIQLLDDEGLRKKLKTKLLSLAKPDADTEIAKIAVSVAKV
ncbi:MAG TPA: undecaprenyldiphospho-muramoylpentapeptide beta-N-acetylglucosaminyltransferase [Saprospiraceae bacterium]|nr:undecaprenyldiphospho-muramoylpentapeptide beta-N-acetylglucosaminyltransferase [Saprospiraceae bacterium]